MRISDWSSDVCSSDLPPARSGCDAPPDGAGGLCFARRRHRCGERSPPAGSCGKSLCTLRSAEHTGAFHLAGRAVTMPSRRLLLVALIAFAAAIAGVFVGRMVSDAPKANETERSEEHTSELQSLMRISYAVFCLNKKIHTTNKKQNLHYKHNNNNYSSNTP